MFGDREESEDLLGSLEETDATELVGRYGSQFGVIITLHSLYPLFDGEDGFWLVLAHEVAYYFRSFCHKAVFTLAELLLFQLTDIFYLIFANHFGFCLQR